MEKISAVVMTYNEEKNIHDLMRNLKDCDEVIIADDGSTDKTREIAENMGATVYIRDKHVDVATLDDVREFSKRFGWLPKFREMPNIPNGAACRNDAIHKARNEWVFMPDADERVTWDMKKLQKVMETADQIECMFVHKRKSNGEPAVTFPITKMFKKSHGTYACRTHDVLLPSGRLVHTDKMRIDHLKKSFGVNPGVLPILEYSVLKDSSHRNVFYLGREYYRHKQYDKAITLLDEYLQAPDFLQEAVEAHYYKAVCFLESGKIEPARDACMKAFALNPDHTRAALLMSQLYQGSIHAKWLDIAKNTKNSDSLF